MAIAGNDIATDTGTLRVSGIPAELVSGHGPHDLTTGEGSPIEIMCKVIGLPLPKHIWYKVGTYLQCCAIEIIHLYYRVPNKSDGRGRYFTKMPT